MNFEVHSSVRRSGKSLFYSESVGNPLGEIWSSLNNREIIPLDCNCSVRGRRFKWWRRRLLGCIDEHTKRKGRNMAAVVLHDMVNRPPSRSLLSKCVTISRYARKFNFIYAHRKNVASPAQIFLKLRKCERHYVHL